MTYFAFRSGQTPEQSQAAKNQETYLVKSLQKRHESLPKSKVSKKKQLYKKITIKEKKKWIQDFKKSHFFRFFIPFALRRLTVCGFILSLSA